MTHDDKPQIGSVRVAGPGFTLYPGESAEVQITGDDLVDALRALHDGRSYQVQHFLISPTPGWRGVFLRTQWRIRHAIGAWFRRGRAR